MIRHLGRLAVITALLLPGTVLAATATVHKTPTCGCCHAYAEHLQANGFDVEQIDHDSMAGEKQEPFTIYRLGANTDAPDVYDRY